MKNVLKKTKWIKEKIESNFLVNEFASHKVYSTKNLNNSDAFLRLFCDKILKIEGIAPVPLEDFYLNTMTKKEKGLLGFRVDCCGTLSSALHSAFIYSDFGIKASFFINHNSNYFKIIKNKGQLKIFCPRTTQEIIKKISKLGHEIGLHNDILDYNYKGWNSRIILKKSIKKLRRISGRKIIGSASHNSAWSYGFENFEIFDEFKLHKEANTIPTLKMSDFGLKYEANFPSSKKFSPAHTNFYSQKFGDDAIRNKVFLVEFFLKHPHFDRGYDYEVWLLGQDLWVLVNYEKNSVDYPINTHTLLEFLAEYSALNGIILIHPEYVSHDVDEQVFSADMIGT